MKKKYVVLSFFLVLILILFVWAIPVLTQEDNTVSVLSGIVRLSISDSEIIQYDDDDRALYFVSKSSLDEKLIESVLPEDGFVLTDQMGSGYLFVDDEDPSNQLLVSGTQFTRFFRLWKIPKDQ